MMSKFKETLGYLLLDLDDWLASRGIYLNWFAREKDNHVNFLCKWGFELLGWFEKTK